MAQDPETLRIATAAEKVTYKWLKQKGRLQYEEEFVFYPLLLGGINLGYLSVNFYVRAGVFGRSLGLRVRPAPVGSDKGVEAKLVMLQEASGTVGIVRIDDTVVQANPGRVLRNALRGDEV